MTDTEMAALVQNACFAADQIAIGFDGTGAELTRAVITRALEALEGNGMIELVAMDDWPMFFVPEPPYTDPLRRQ